MTALVIADGDVVARGLVALLGDAGRAVVVAGPHLGLQVRNRTWDVAVVALADPVRSLDVVRRLAPVPCVVLHRTGRRADREAAWRAGAAAWVGLDVTAFALDGLLSAVEAGERVFSAAVPAARPLLGQSLSRRSDDPDPLTPREAEIVAMVVAGHTNKQIAHRLGLAEQTVKNHLVRTMDKAGVSSRVQLYGWAVSRSA